MFDLDGTLVDSRDDIVNAGRHALARHGRPQKPEGTIASYVGDGARVFVARLFDTTPGDPHVEEYLATFLPYYAAHAADSTRLMPGALAAMDALARTPLALCTNKPRAATEAVLARLGVAGRFRVVVAGGDVPVNKPDPAPLLFIAGRLGVSARDLVMVGDGVQDIASGRAAGALTVAVLGGFTDEATLRGAGPDHVIPRLNELPRLVERSGDEGVIRGGELGKAP